MTVLSQSDTKLSSRSHPDSPKYRQHYTSEEINDLFAPSSTSVSTVRQWLESVGVAAERVSQSLNKQWLQFDATVEELESLLQAKYHVYEHKNGFVTAGCDE